MYGANVGANEGIAANVAIAKSVFPTAIKCSKNVSLPSKTWRTSVISFAAGFL